MGIQARLSAAQIEIACGIDAEYEAPASHINRNVTMLDQCILAHGPVNLGVVIFDERRDHVATRNAYQFNEKGV